jgi:hypothetical protein
MPTEPGEPKKGKAAIAGTIGPARRCVNRQPPPLHVGGTQPGRLLHHPPPPLTQPQALDAELARTGGGCCCSCPRSASRSCTCEFSLMIGPRANATPGPRGSAPSTRVRRFDVAAVRALWQERAQDGLDYVRQRVQPEKLPSGIRTYAYSAVFTGHGTARHLGPSRSLPA